MLLPSSTGSQASSVTMVAERAASFPTRGAQLRKGGRAKLSRPPPLGGETGELQLNDRSEAPGTENNQWRSSQRLRRLEGGSGRERSSLPVREKRRKLSRPPLQGRDERSDDDERE